MNYYKRHLGDYAKDTGHLSALEHGVYTLLLDRYYSTERPIPEAEAHKVARARSPVEREAADSVLREFFKLRDGEWHHNYADGVIAAAQERAAQNRDIGRLGGRPPNSVRNVSRGTEAIGIEATTVTVPLNNPTGTQTVSQNNPIPLATSHKPIEEKESKDAARPRAEYPQDFKTAWDALPKREGGNPQRAAYGCWKARLAEGHKPEEMIEGAKRYASWCRATGKTGTETVMQAKRFFGREKEFLLPWAVGGAKPEPTADELAAAELRNRIQAAWGEVSTAARLGVSVRGADAQIALEALDRIGGMDALKRLPPRELSDKGASFAREFSALARAA